MGWDLRGLRLIEDFEVLEFEASIEISLGTFGLSLFKHHNDGRESL